MFLLKKILAGLVLPPASLLLIAAVGLVAQWSARPAVRRIGMAAAAGALLLLFALSLPVVGQGLLATLERHPPVDPARAAGAQAIVVLGGGAYRNAPEYGGDTVNHFSLERVRYAARLARQTGLPLLVTGGVLSGERPEAHSMREVLAEFGVPVRWVEAQALDTRDNARFSARLLKSDGVTRILLVSHGWHLPRAVPLFEREGLAVVPAPTRFTTGSPSLWLPGDLRDARLAVHEYLGRLADVLSGR